MPSNDDDLLDHRDLNQDLGVFATDPLAGAGLPLWLAPVQACVLPVSPGQDAIARDLHDRLIAAGLRPRLDADGSLGARIRRARQRRDCLIAVLGQAEAAAGAVQVTDIAGGFCGQVAAGDLIRLATGAHAGRQARIDWASAVS